MLFERYSIPPGHPLRRLLHHLTEMSFQGIGLSERDLIDYVSGILANFVHVDNLYKLRDQAGKRMEYIAEMLMECEKGTTPSEREARKHIGDHCMFVVGLFPESLSGRRRLVGPEYYIEQGKSSYLKVSMMDYSKPTESLFRKLADRFEECVTALHVERDYLNDPFYQYIMRQVWS